MIERHDDPRHPITLSPRHPVTPSSPASRLPPPAVSVVIPTYNRAVTLAKVLEALWAQSLPDDEFEIVLVDDGSTDATPDAVRPFLGRPGPQRRYLRQTNRGPAAARNAGLAASRGRWIVFLGDDTLPARDFLEQHVGYHRQHDADGRLAVVGYTTWPAGLRPTPFLRFAGEEGPQFDYAHMAPRTPLSYWHFYTSNLSLSRGLLEGLDRPFDERFTAAMWEDAELGYRLAQRGMVLHYHPGAVAYHDHPMTLAAHCRRTREVGRVSRQLLAKHPELQPVLQSTRRLRRVCRLTAGLCRLVPLADFLDRRLRVPLPGLFYRALLTAFYARGATGASLASCSSSAMASAPSRCALR